jgi:putative phosphoesterase
VTELLILSDTHIPDFARALPASVLALAGRADLVIHAGDATSPIVLDQLSALAPVVAVIGNMDDGDVEGWGAVRVATTTVEGLVFAVVHDSGRRAGRAERLRKRFPDADVVVYGHSHQPELRREGDLWLVNPGSPTWKRREPQATVITATVTGDRFEARLVDVSGK